MLVFLARVPSPKPHQQTKRITSEIYGNNKGVNDKKK